MPSDHSEQSQQQTMRREVLARSFDPALAALEKQIEKLTKDGENLKARYARQVDETYNIEENKGNESASHEAAKEKYNCIQKTIEELQYLITYLKTQKKDYIENKLTLEEFKKISKNRLTWDDCAEFSKARGNYSFIRLLDAITYAIDRLVERVCAYEDFGFQHMYPLFHIKTTTETKIANMKKAIEATMEEAVPDEQGVIKPQ